jgi:hypothetical protein
MHTALEIFVGKLEGNQPPRRLKRKFQDNIKMKLSELGRDKLEQFFLLPIQ